MRWFGWFRKQPALVSGPVAVPAPPLAPAPNAPNMFGEIALPEASPKWKVDGNGKTSTNYKFGDDMYIWAYHSGKIAHLYVDGIKLIEGDARLYAFSQTIQELDGLKEVAKDKQRKLRALAHLEEITAKSKTS